MATYDESKSYRLGVKVGREFADSLQIGMVCAVVLGVIEHLDDSLQSITTPSEILSYPVQVDEEQYIQGYEVGLQGRCGEIVDAINAKTTTY